MILNSLKPTRESVFCSSGRIPLHCWNYNTFANIGKAHGGFQAVARENMEMESLIEVKVKVRYNYAGFVPASVLISDDQGVEYVVYIVPPPDGRWFVERNVSFHGSFKTKATDEFDEHNPQAKAYSFVRIHVVPLETTKFETRTKFVKSDWPSDLDPPQTKKDCSSDLEYDPFDQQICDRRKEKGKAIMSINE